MIRGWSIHHVPEKNLVAFASISGYERTWRVGATHLKKLETSHEPDIRLNASMGL
jgi:hypothetical protein